MLTYVIIHSAGDFDHTTISFLISLSHIGNLLNLVKYHISNLDLNGE